MTAPKYDLVIREPEEIRTSFRMGNIDSSMAMHELEKWLLFGEVAKAENDRGPKFFCPLCGSHMDTSPFFLWCKEHGAFKVIHEEGKPKVTKVDGR